MIEIHNPNYLSPKMQLIDIKYTFNIKDKGIIKFIYEELIGPGYLKKVNERYYAPTQLLLDMAFLPKKLNLQEFQARYLSYNSHFSKTDLIELFDDNEQIVKQLIKIGFLSLQKNGNYSKAAKFEEALAEGEMQFSLVLTPEERR